MKPEFLCMYVVDGVGEPALKGTNLTQEGYLEGEFVPRVAGVANRTERSDEDVEGGKMVE